MTLYPDGRFFFLFDILFTNFVEMIAYSPTDFPLTALAAWPPFHLIPSDHVEKKTSNQERSSESGLVGK